MGESLQGRMLPLGLTGEIASKPGLTHDVRSNEVKKCKSGILKEIVMYFIS